MSVASKIKSTELYLSGAQFTSAEMGILIDEPQRRVAWSLRHMRQLSEVKSGDGKWWMPTQHWINQRRLANTAFLSIEQV